MPFEVAIHPAENVLEIAYPKEMTPADVTAYANRCRESILKLGPRWSCLVDQTACPLLPHAFADEIAALNTFALAHGMERCARVVSGVIGELQAWRVTREVKGSVPVRTFATTKEAWAWIRAERADRK